MDSLLPCPFCGGEAKAYVRDYGDTHYWRVSCLSDRCGVNPVTNVYHTEAGAIAAWNTRAERTCEVEVRESGWGGYTRHCANCGADLDCDTRNKQNYCPNCGAKVIGGERCLNQ